MKLLTCSISSKVDMVKLYGGKGETGDNLFLKVCWQVIAAFGVTSSGCIA
jgi:hypothetical protein